MKIKTALATASAIAFAGTAFADSFTFRIGSGHPNGPAVYVADVADFFVPEVKKRAEAFIADLLGKLRRWRCVARTEHQPEDGGPLEGEAGILVAEIDPGRRTEGLFDLDVTGHYARPDVFELRVDPREQRFRADIED